MHMLEAMYHVFFWTFSSLRPEAPGYFTLQVPVDHPPISMVIFDPILVPSTPPRTIARVTRGEVRLS